MRVSDSFGVYLRKKSLPVLIVTSIGISFFGGVLAICATRSKINDEVKKSKALIRQAAIRDSVYRNETKMYTEKISDYYSNCKLKVDGQEITISQLIDGYSKLLKENKELKKKIQLPFIGNALGPEGVTLSFRGDSVITKITLSNHGPVAGVASITVYLLQIRDTQVSRTQLVLSPKKKLPIPANMFVSFYIPLGLEHNPYIEGYDYFFVILGKTYTPQGEFVSDIEVVYYYDPILKKAKNMFFGDVKNALKTATYIGHFVRYVDKVRLRTKLDDSNVQPIRR